MLTSSPLIFRWTVPLTMSPSLQRETDSASHWRIRSAFRFESRISPNSSSISSSSTATLSPGCGGGAPISHCVERDDPFALVTDVDEDCVPFIPDDGAVDDRVDIDNRPALGVEVFEAFILSLFEVVQAGTQNAASRSSSLMLNSRRNAINHARELLSLRCSSASCNRLSVTAVPARQGINARDWEFAAPVKGHAPRQNGTHRPPDPRRSATE